MRYEEWQIKVIIVLCRFMQNRHIEFHEIILLRLLRYGVDWSYLLDSVNCSIIEILLESCSLYHLPLYVAV